jgi:hypothetical protein
MKLYLPIFNQKQNTSLPFPLFSGAAIANPKLINHQLPETEVIIKLWDEFSVINQKNMGFNASGSLQFYLDELFDEESLNKATLATAEFDPQTLPASKILKLQGLYEVKSLLRSSSTEAGVLYDLINDKMANHKYSPIIHPLHAGVPQSLGDSETFCLFVNFRPPELKPKENQLHLPFEAVSFQKMHLELKKASGNVISEKIITIPYNSTYLISLRDEFKNFGGYEHGDQIVFKGGASQFAIFNLFINPLNKSIGIEHSLPPVYYSSGLFKPEQRSLFYKRAFEKVNQKLMGSSNVDQRN